MSFVSRYLEPNLVERLNQLQLSARSVVEGTIAGAHRSPLKGASVEFRQHRFYVPGDEPRRLDWRVLARTDRPYIKEYDEETNLRCALLLDASGSMAYGRPSTGRADALPGTKFDYAATVVASLAFLMLGQTESVGLALFGERVQQWLAPRAGTGQLSQVIDLLERAAPHGASNLGGAMREVAERLGRRSLVIAVSDGFAPIASLKPGLARLRHGRHEIVVIQVLDRAEVEFPFKRWTRFRGLEGGPPKLCEPAVVRKLYLENFRRHRRQLQEACRAAGAEFYSFTTDRPVIETITTFLHRGER